MVGKVFVDCCGNSVGTGALVDIKNIVDIGYTAVKNGGEINAIY